VLPKTPKPQNPKTPIYTFVNNFGKQMSVYFKFLEIEFSEKSQASDQASCD